MFNVLSNGHIALLQDNYLEIYSGHNSFTDYVWRKEGKKKINW